MTAAGFDDAKKNKFKAELAKIKTYATNLKKGKRVIIDTNDKVRVPKGGDKEDGTKGDLELKTGEKEFFCHDYNEGKNNLVFSDLYNFFDEFFKLTDISDKKHIINTLDNK